MIEAYLIPLKQNVKVKMVYTHWYKAYNENGYIGTYFVDSIVFNQKKR